MKTYMLLLLVVLTACALTEEVPEEELVEEEVPEVVVPEVEEVTEPPEVEAENDTLVIPEVEKIEEPELTIPEPPEEEYKGNVVEVVIENREIKPKVAIISVGDTIVWKVLDRVSVKLSGSIIKPPVLYYGDEYAMKFERPGVFPYVDEYHSSIFGEIRVSEPELELEQPVEEPDGLHFVNMQDYAYTPKYLTIKKGEIVIWEAFDSTAVTVDGAGFSSGPLRKGDKFHHAFNLTGSFPYGSIFQSNMLGTIIVEG